MEAEEKLLDFDLKLRKNCQEKISKYWESLTEDTKTHAEFIKINFKIENILILRMLEISRVIVQEMAMHMSPQKGQFEFRKL